MATVSHDSEISDAGLIGALRRLRDPLLLARLSRHVRAPARIGSGTRRSWPIGFDFRGTLWEPARALLDGLPIYPEPTRESSSSATRRSIRRSSSSRPSRSRSSRHGSPRGSGSACSPRASSRRCGSLGVRDWRCHVLAVTSPVVVHGLYYGNLTIVLVLPLALAWRYRDRARLAGLALGAAVAAKLFVWPLVVWLLLTRRFRAAAWAVAAGGRPRPRRLGADRLRGSPRLSGAAARGAGRLRDPERLALDGRGRARRLGRRRGRGRRESPASPASVRPPGSCGAPTATGARSRSSSRRASSPPRSSGRTTRRSSSCRSRSLWPRLAPGLVLRLRDLARGVLAPKPVDGRSLLPAGRRDRQQAWAASHAGPDSGSPPRSSARRWSSRSWCARLVAWRRATRRP